MSDHKIDHFVFAAETLNQGSEIIKNLLKEDLSDINAHKTMGTHNRVISLGSCYLEVISLDPQNQNVNKKPNQKILVYSGIILIAAIIIFSIF